MAYRCRKCGNTRAFYVAAREFHTWMVDGNGYFIEDRGCDDSDALPENYIACIGPTCGAENADIDRNYDPAADSKRLKNARFGELRWAAEDIQAVRPSWSLEKAHDWLEKNQKCLRERLVELGYEVIEALIMPEDEESSQ